MLSNETPSRISSLSQQSANVAPPPVPPRGASPRASSPRPAPPAPPAPPPAAPAVTQNVLEDAALRAMIETKLSFPPGEVVLAIRLLPDHSDEFLYLICRRNSASKEDLFLVEGISPKLKSTFSYKLGDLLHLSDEPNSNLVTLQFSGSRSVIVCLDDEEKNWMFYCTTRLCREFANNQRVAIVTENNLRLRTSEQVLKMRCPILLGSKMTEDVRTATPPKSFLNSTLLPSPNSSYEKPIFGGDENNKPEQQNQMETKDRLLNDIFPESQSRADLVEWFADAERANVIQAEEQTMRDLSVWESSAANNNNDVVGLGHGRDGDPIASMLQHLENVELRLAQVDDWMKATQAKSNTALILAQDVSKELALINTDTAFKTKIAAHLDQVLTSG